MVLILPAPVISSGQSHESRVAVNISYEHFFLSGNDYRDYSYVSLPALFSNMKMTNGYSAEVIFKAGSFLGAGLKYRDVSLTNWQLDGQVYYSNVKSSINSISPVVLITPLPGGGLKPGLSFKLILPGFTRLKLEPREIPKPFTIDDYFNFMGKERITILIPGFGIEATSWKRLSSSIGITAGVGWIYYKTDSYFFPDASISGLTTRLGLAFNLYKDKLYIYR